jgi:hypothetical protein
VTLDDVRVSRASQASALRRLADAAIAAAVALDDPASLPDELDTTHRRVIDRVQSAKAAHAVHAASRAGYARSTS